MNVPESTIAMRDVPILGIRTTAQSFTDAMTTLARWAVDDGRRYVCTATVYGLMQCLEHHDVRTAFAQADMVTADGMPLVWEQRRLMPAAERVYGPDMLLALCEQSARFGLRHALVGGNSGIAQRLANSLQARFDGLSIVANITPPNEAPFPQLDQATIDQLNAAHINVLWVGLGSPKQDLWMYHHRRLLNAHVMIGVGAAFDFLAGVKPQAPLWMRSSGLEWLFRLASEPRRLWRRYLVYNSLYLWRLWRSRRAERARP